MVLGRKTTFSDTGSSSCSVAKFSNDATKASLSCVGRTNLKHSRPGDWPIYFKQVIIRWGRKRNQNKLARFEAGGYDS